MPIQTASKRARVLTLAAAILVVSGVLLGSAVIVYDRTESAARLPASELVPSDPAEVTGVGGAWSVVATRGDGNSNLFKEWQSGSNTFAVEARRYGTPTGATFSFLTEDVAREHGHDPPADAIAYVATPSGMSANQATILCANTNHSRSRADVEGCVTWMALLRFGQYTVFVGLSWDAGMSRPQFEQVIRRVDLSLADLLRE